jgi:lysophospholipid acyltransferase (LPLAT)-like uncharacterized protein
MSPREQDSVHGAAQGAGAGPGASQDAAQNATRNATHDGGVVAVPPSGRRPLSRVQRIAIYLGPWLIRALASTWRVRVVNDAGWRARRAKKQSFVFTLWHGELLPILAQHRGEGIMILISEHRDGEVIAQIAQRMGCKTVRGSTSRGAARALLAMTRALEDGQELAVTPDGPRGPRHHFAPGALVAAHRAGAPIVGIGIVASRAWRLNSWDAFMIPKPFARVTVTYSDPTFVAGADARAASDESPRFEALMRALGESRAASVPSDSPAA